MITINKHREISPVLKVITYDAILNKLNHYTIFLDYGTKNCAKLVFGLDVRKNLHKM